MGSSVVANTLYVGNLPYSVNDDALYDMFEKSGVCINHCRVITDRETKRSKGFGFVELKTQQEAEQAMKALDGQEFGGRRLKVSMAVEDAARSGARPQQRSNYRVLES